jgi:hypothetical protein
MGLLRPGRPLPFLVSWVDCWVIAPLAQPSEKLLAYSAARLIFSGTCIRVEGERFPNEQGIRISPRSRHAQTIRVSSALMAF